MRVVDERIYDAKLAIVTPTSTLHEQSPYLRGDNRKSHSRISALMSPIPIENKQNGGTESQTEIVDSRSRLTYI